jgi:hypothetical protein
MDYWTDVLLNPLLQCIYTEFKETDLLLESDYVNDKCLLIIANNMKLCHTVCIAHITYNIKSTFLLSS